MRFPVNIAKFFRTSILKNICKQLIMSLVTDFSKHSEEKLNEISNSTYQKLNINFKHQFTYQLY